MKHLIPNSLFWRLILVLFAGLFVSQLISLMINYEDKGQLLSQTESRQSAQRIADSVYLLDSLEANSREQMSCEPPTSPRRGVTLRKNPIIINSAYTKNSAIETFSDGLTEALGEKKRFIVTQIDSNTVIPRTQTRRHGNGMGRQNVQNRERMSHNRMERIDSEHDTEKNDHNEVSFLVQVQLLDGQWAIFQTDIPKTSAILSVRLLTTLFIFIVVVMILSFVAVRWVTRPLHQLAKAADALGRNINQEPLPETGPTEIRQAAHAFNLMQKRLKGFIQDRTHIFAAMSHDLKTPITRLRLRAEMLDDDDLRQRFEKDLIEMEFMVMQALDFMKGLDTKEQQQPVNMMALLESIQEDYADAGKNITITGKTNEPFIGLASLLKRCLTNLIDNAIFYGQEAYINIEENKEYLTISIRDNGPGIAESEQDRVFDPFYRLESSRNRETGGTGLGLTITRNIIQTHGGEILLKNHPEGGLEAIITLPKDLSSAKSS